MDDAAIGVPSAGPHDPPRPTSLMAGAFRPLWVLTFLAYGFDALLRAIVPIIALDQGGDAVLVGLLGTAFAIPSVIFRPIVGSLIDGWQHRLLLRSGALAIATLPLLLLIPGSIALLISRFLYGTGWAFFSVSNHAVLARLAPPGRRAEAAAGYLTAGAIGALILPGLGVALYTALGIVPPVLFVVALGLLGVMAVLRIHVATAPTAAGKAVREPLLTRFLEPSALAGTLMLVTAYSSWSIFTVFPSVYAQHVQAPVEVLIAYFPIWGLAQVISQPYAGRLGDRLGRARSMVLGSAVASAALLVALIPGFVTFTIAAVLYAVSQSLVMATISALTMERAPKHRLGSAMATYSVGYQVATGLSSLLWGAMIATLGFTWVFVVALGFQALTIGLIRVLLPPRSGTLAAA